MLATSETALRAIMRADASVSREQEEAAIRAAKGTPTNTEPLDPILTVAETGKLCGGKDRHTLREWERRGWLVAIRTGAKGHRITGYTASSVRALLAGKANTNGKEVA